MSGAVTGGGWGTGRAATGGSDGRAWCETGGGGDRDSVGAGRLGEVSRANIATSIIVYVHAEF